MATKQTHGPIVRRTTPEPDWLAEAQHIADLYEYPGIGPPASAITDLQRVSRLFYLIGHGNYVSTALLAAGFSRQHLADWKRQAEEGSVAAIALLYGIEKAEAFAEADAVSDVESAGKAGPQFWAASATRLERRHPERWGKRAEETAGPRVIVQIGIQAQDVQVQTLSPQDVPKLDE